MPRHRKLGPQALLSLLALATLALLVVDCGLPLEPASGTFGSVYKAIQGANCVRCHAPAVNEAAGGSTLDFSSQSLAYSTLTTNNVTATSTAACNSAKIVVAGSPTTSYLAAVLFSDYHTNDFAGISGCTPYNAHHSDVSLSSAEKTSILDWITNGAKND